MLKRFSRLHQNPGLQVNHLFPSVPILAGFALLFITVETSQLLDASMRISAEATVQHCGNNVFTNRLSPLVFI